MTQACTQRLLGTIAVSAVLLAPAFAVAKENYFLQLPVVLDAAAPIEEAVKNQCTVETLLGNHALAEIGKRAGDVQSVAEPGQAGDGKLVRITILSARGAGGGAWTGPKSMVIRVEAKKGDALLGETTLQRSSGGGAFGGFSGTCAIFERITVALGKDVAVWLERGARSRPAKQSSADASEPAEAAVSEEKK